MIGYQEYLYLEISKHGILVCLDDLTLDRVIQRGPGVGGRFAVAGKLVS